MISEFSIALRRCYSIYYNKRRENLINVAGERGRELLGNYGGEEKCRELWRSEVRGFSFVKVKSTGNQLCAVAFNCLVQMGLGSTKNQI